MASTNPDPTPTPNRRASRATVLRRLKGVVALLAAIGILPVMWWFVRTEPAIGVLADDAIARVTHGTGLRVIRGRVAPHGWTGVELRDVIVRRPDETGSLWLAVDHIYIDPDLGALLTGDVRIRSVVLDGVEANIEVAEGDRGDLAIVEKLLAARKGTDKGAAPTPRRDKRLEMLPSLSMTRGKVRVVDLDKRFEPVWFTSKRLELGHRESWKEATVYARGDVTVDAYGEGAFEVDVTLPGGDARVSLKWPEPRDLTASITKAMPSRLPAGATVTASAVTVTWPPTVALHGLALDGLEAKVPWTVPGATDERGAPVIVGFDATQLDTRIGEEGGNLHTVDAVAKVLLPGHTEPTLVPLGEATVIVDPSRDEFRLSSELHDELGLGSVHATWNVPNQTLDITARVQDVPWKPYAGLVPAAAARHAHLKDGRISGTMVLDFEFSLGLVDIHMDLNIHEGQLKAPVLSTHELKKVEIATKGHVLVDMQCRCVWVRDGDFALGELRTKVDGRVFNAGDGWLIEMDVQTPEMVAQRVLDSMPTGFVPALEGYQLEGSLQGHMNLKVDTRAVDDLELDADIRYDEVHIVRAGPNTPLLQLGKEAFALDARGLKDKRTIGPSAEEWVAWKDIPAVVPQAIVSAEDGSFWKHSGFDVRGIRAALVHNFREGRIARGGSTISQQVIKNLFLNHDRTAGRKIQEAFLTWHMEQAIPKERILEIYLNMLHLGPGIYGIREASRELFDKPPTKLSLREAVFLGSILPNPNHFIRLYARSIIPPDRRLKMRNILNNMQRSGFIGPRTAARTAGLTDMAVISITPPPRRYAKGG